MTFFGIFLLAWHEFVAVHYADSDREKLFSKMTNTIFQLFFELCIGIIFVLPIVFDIIINSNYAEAYNNIPIYMVAFLFNVIIGILGGIYVANKKTIEIVKTTTIAAIINVISNIILIKELGLYAASISTLIGYLVAMINRLIDTRKYVAIQFDLKKIIELSIILLISIIVFYNNSIVLSIIFSVVYMVYCLVANKNILKQGIELLRKRTDEKNN